ncbi:unnamed protein product [Laminaria digitata]
MEYEYDRAASAINLMSNVTCGNMRGVQAAVAAGADLNGHPDLPCPPVMAAIIWDSVSMAKFLLELGADPNKPAENRVPFPDTDVVVMPGERALHMAAKRGNVEIVRFLLGRAGTDPNAADQTGGTPLMAACTCKDNYAAVVRLLLKAGADPALTEQDGFTAMHLVAQHGGHLDLVKMLYRRAPATLNSYSSAQGETPLFLACANGHESMVYKLLSLGAIQRDRCKICPLKGAIFKGYVGVVEMLLDEGIGVVGGPEVLPTALYTALVYRQAIILQMLLEAGEEDAPIWGGDGAPVLWANIECNQKSLLHHAAGFCCPASVSVLLAEGADEAARNSAGRLPRDAIGVGLGREQLPMDRGKEVAIRRMLRQGPAYRARSWAWPAREAGGGGGGGGGAVVSSQPAAPNAPVGVRIFRPESDTTRRRLFVGLVGRYCQKN